MSKQLIDILMVLSGYYRIMKDFYSGLFYHDPKLILPIMIFSTLIGIMLIIPIWSLKRYEEYVDSGIYIILFIVMTLRLMNKIEVDIADYIFLVLLPILIGKYYVK